MCWSMLAPEERPAFAGGTTAERGTSWELHDLPVCNVETVERTNNGRSVRVPRERRGRRRHFSQLRAAFDLTRDRGLG